MGLSPWQLKRQLAWWIGRQVWSEAPGGLVLSGGAFVSEDGVGNFRPGNRDVDGPVAIGVQADGGFRPFAVVSAKRIAEWDPDFSGCAERVELVARFVAGGGFGTPTATAGIDPASKGNTSAAGYDTHGVNQVTGALRATPNGQGQSQGRDVDELLSQIVQQLGVPGFVDSVHGFQGRVVAWGPIEPALGVQVLARGLVVEAFSVTASNHYHRVIGVGTINAGAGSVTVVWTAAPPRFDFVTYMVRRGQNPGDAAPATINDGVLVAQTAATNTVANGLAAGQTYNFSVFVGYGETPAAQQAGTPDRWSGPVSRSGTA
jgi:hypothetical protein